MRQAAIFSYRHFRRIVSRAGRQSGFTLLEMLVIAGVVGLLLTLALPRYAGFVRDRGVTKAAEDIVSILRFAQQSAVANTVDSCGYRVRISATQAEAQRIPRDSAGNCGSADTVRVTDAFPGAVTASPADTDIDFTGAGRVSTGDVTITLSSGSRTRTVSVEAATGKAEVGP